MFSNTAITVERAAKLMKRKKKAPTMRPTTGPIMLNTLGRDTKASPGPAPASTLNAAHAGKIINPAQIATKVSSPITRSDSPVSEWSLPMYEPKISIEPIPSDSVKKACPIAA